MAMAAGAGATAQTEVGEYRVSRRAMSVELPDVYDYSGPHRVMIGRTDYSETGIDYLRIAEALLPPREIVTRAARVAHFKLDEIPDDPDLWWSAEFDGMRIPYAINALTIDYYLGLTEDFKSGDFSGVKGIEMLESDLYYEAYAKHHETFHYGAQVFTDVHVARLHLKWHAYCGVVCAIWIDHERIVVLSPEGDPIAVFGDENILFRVS